MYARWSLSEDHALVLRVDLDAEEVLDLPFVLHVPLVGEGLEELRVQGVLVIMRAVCKQVVHIDAEEQDFIARTVGSRYAGAACEDAGVESALFELDGGAVGRDAAPLKYPREDGTLPAPAGLRHKAGL